LAKLEAKNLTFSYNPKRKILKNINLKIEKGQWVSILGHNGSGKSTLAKTLVGLLECQEGGVWIDDEQLTEKNLYELRKKIGIVFQNPDNQFVGVTVRDDIAFGMENLCVSREDMLKNIDFYSDKVGMNGYLDKEPSTLSGGQKQRVAIAGILAMHTDIMIFDEATSMLDPYARKDLMKYIRQLHQEGLTIVMITHDIEEALLSERIVVLKNGEIVLDGPIHDVLSHPQELQDAHLSLPVSLQIASQLPEDSEWRDYLWQFTLNK